MRRVIAFAAATGATVVAALVGVTGCASSNGSTISTGATSVSTGSAGSTSTSPSGTGSTATGSTSTSPGSTSTSPSGTGSTTGNHTLPHASCGSAVTHVLSASTRLLSADRGALTCFTAAAKTCTAAGLHVTEMGVDIGTRWVFAIVSGGTPGRCVVTSYSQHYSARAIGGIQVVKTASCQETAVTSKGVTLSCPGQVIMIPAAVSAA